MSPDLQLYYNNVQVQHIAKGAGVSVPAMNGRLVKERKFLGLKSRGRSASRYVGEDIAEFINDKSLVLELAKDGMEATTIGDKWGINRRTVVKYLSKWGFVLGKESENESISLSDLYTGWADIRKGTEMLLTINRKPMFKLVRII